MTTQDFQAYWSQSFAETPPINHLFKHNLKERWLRIHSLPEAKRYAETEAEWSILLHRQHTLFQDLMSQNEAFYVLSGLYSFGDKVFDKNIFSDYDFFKTLTIHELERIDLFKNSGDWYDEGSFYTPFFVKASIKSYGFDAILRAVADDEIRVFFLNTSTNTIIAPYDGGVDVILKDSETMLFYKEKYKNWLPERADGL